MSILFKNAKIITTEKGSMKVLENSYLGVDGKFIDYIGTQKPKKSYTEEIDMYDKILMPGIVNGHAHSAMNLLKGLGSDLPLQEWLENAVWPIEGKMRDQDFVSGMNMIILEMLASGTTSFSDMYFRPMITQKCIEESGMTLIMPHSLIDSSPLNFIRTSTELLMTGCTLTGVSMPNIQSPKRSQPSGQKRFRSSADVSIHMSLRQSAST